MSKGRLKSIHSGNIDLYDAFRKSEDGFIYQAIIPENANFDIFEVIFYKNTRLVFSRSRIKIS